MSNVPGIAITPIRAEMEEIRQSLPEEEQMLEGDDRDAIEAEDRARNSEAPEPAKPVPGDGRR